MKIADIFQKIILAMLILFVGFCIGLKTKENVAEQKAKDRYCEFIDKLFEEKRVLVESIRDNTAYRPRPIPKDSFMVHKSDYEHLRKSYGYYYDKFGRSPEKAIDSLITTIGDLKFKLACVNVK